MHLGRRYKFAEFLGWTRWEAAYLLGWSLVVTAVLQVTHWNFLTIPAPILTIVGSALAIILAFKNAQCYARFNEALSTSGQLISNSYSLANRLTSTVGNLDAAQSGARLKDTISCERGNRPDLIHYAPHRDRDADHARRAARPEADRTEATRMAPARAAGAAFRGAPFP